MKLGKSVLFCLLYSRHLHGTINATAQSNSALEFSMLCLMRVYQQLTFYRFHLEKSTVGQ